MGESESILFVDGENQISVNKSKMKTPQPLDQSIALKIISNFKE